MKHFYLKSLLAGLFLFAASSSFAYDFEVDGIYYNILSEEEKTVEVTSGNSYTGIIVIPEEVIYDDKKYLVTSIGVDAFAESEIQAVTIPNTVNIIKGDAFMRCRKLNSVTIPNSVRTIEIMAFWGCNSLTEIYLPESVESIGNYTFDSCQKLEKINIPNSVKAIGEYAFANCISLTSIEIPSSITIIESGVFNRCFNLTNCIIPNSVKRIEYGAFSECRSLQTINIPNSVTTLEDRAFSDCYSLSSVFIPNSVTTITGNPFSYCSGIKTIKVDSNNPKYDSREECNAIIETETNTLIRGCVNTTIPKTIEHIGNYAFSGCSDITTLIVPESVKTIGEWTFSLCNSLNTFHIPNYVTSIGDFAFYKCTSLSSINIPQFIVNLGEYAFSECTNLHEIVSFIEKPFTIPNNISHIQSTGKQIFTDATLYVPVGTKELYESTPGWNLFKNIVEMGLTPVEEDSGEKDFGADAGISEDTKMDGNIVNDIFYNILEDNGFYNREEGCIVIKKETVDEFLDYIESKNLFSDEVKQQFTGLALMLKANCQWLKITAEASGNMTLKVKIGNMPPMEMALDGKKTVEIPCSLAEPAMAYIYGSLLPHANAKGMRRAKAGKADDELKIYSIAWSEEQEATGIRHTVEQEATAEPGVYNLQGQRVIPSRQGIYIANGKKLLVK